MSHYLKRTLLVLTVLGSASRSAVGQAPPVVPPPPRPQVNPGPALLLPSPPAPAPNSVRAPRGAVRASVSPVTIPLLAAPAASPRPDSLPTRRERITLVNPTPLTRQPPRAYRVRSLGNVAKPDVAEIPAPAGATGRCKDGTYLTGPATDESCGGRGGLAIRMASPRKPPPAPRGS
jgi:hypothetical protein